MQNKVLRIESFMNYNDILLVCSEYKRKYQMCS